jgi:hypothetical protein
MSGLGAGTLHGSEMRYGMAGVMSLPAGGVSGKFL